MVENNLQLSNICKEQLGTQIIKNYFCTLNFDHLSTLLTLDCLYFWKANVT